MADLLLWDRYYETVEQERDAANWEKLSLAADKLERIRAKK